MALMTVSNEDTGDFRSKARWSAGKKLDVVLRLLRGDKLEELSREVGRGSGQVMISHHARTEIITSST